MKTYFYGLLAFLTIACQTMNEPIYQSFKPLSIDKLDVSEVVLSGELTYLNTNAIGGRLEEINLNVYANEVYISDLTQNLDIEVKPNAAFTIPIKIVVPVKDLLSKDSGLLGGLVNALTSKKVKVKYTGTAVVNFAKMKIPIVIDKEEELTIKL